MANGQPDLEISVDAYCTMDHIQALLPHRTFNTSSKPSKLQAANIARQTFARMNGILDVIGYEIAVASGNATNIRILEEINSLGAAARIEGSTYSAGNVERSDTEISLREQFNEIWVQFEEGKISIPEATRTADRMLRADERHPKYSFNEDAQGNETGSVFKKGMDW